MKTREAAFAETNNTSIEEVKAELCADIEKVRSYSQTDKFHSASFYTNVLGKMEAFGEMLNHLVAIENLGPFWSYDLDVTGNNIALFLRHHVCIGSDEGQYFFDCNQEYKLCETEEDYVSIEDYSTAYGTSPATVRQWIRRGKIPRAKKVVNTWLIPELNDVPLRGFEPATYTWHGAQIGIPREYGFIEGASFISIDKSTGNKGAFKVTVKYGRDDRENEEKLYNKAEKEKFEMFLISHPNIMYCAGYDETLEGVLESVNYNEEVKDNN